MNIGKYILLCSIIYIVLTIPATADTWEPCCSQCKFGYPVIYSITLFIPGLLILNLILKPDETWHVFSFQNFLNAYKRPPQDDKGHWLFNYVLHPLWGSETYLRARMNGCSWWQSWLFSNAMSILWEYGFESWNEHPSIQDLLITGNIGSIIGEIRYRLLIHLKKKRASPERNSLIFILDPIQSTLECIF